MSAITGLYATRVRALWAALHQTGPASVDRLRRETRLGLWHPDLLERAVEQALDAGRVRELLTGELEAVPGEVPM